jgi:hypothetical protein
MAWRSYKECRGNQAEGAPTKRSPLKKLRGAAAAGASATADSETAETAKTASKQKSAAAIDLVRYVALRSVRTGCSPVASVASGWRGIASADRTGSTPTLQYGLPSLTGTIVRALRTVFTGGLRLR